jgi:trimeric autotransporter adhesin
MNKRPEMRRDGTSFVPRVRGSSESISRVGGAAGLHQERPKNEGKSNMKSRKIIFITVLPALVCFALLPKAQAASEKGGGPAAPQIALPGFNTADGDHALFNVTTGSGNTGVGWYALFADTTNSFNTGLGAGALVLNTADDNTAVGAVALLLNTTGTDNIAVGTAALENNADGSDNNAVGSFALSSNVSGTFNNAHGRDALLNSTGDQNNAMGDDAMFFNTTGSFNTAVGDDALDNNVDGNSNVAIGDEAGTGLGASVSNCIAIGAPGAGPFAVLSNTCFIGSIFGQPVSDPGSQTAVFVDQFNVVGIFNSSRQYKHDIQPMDKASETLYQFKPVTFKFNSDWKGTTQYGLIAEEVAEVDPQLVSRKNGEIVTVHYEQISNMLLNEFLKEHKKVQDLETTVAQQAKGMEVLTAQLREQAAQIQKVSAQLEVNKPAPQVVANKP